jgi:hypothetical protein
VTRSLSAALVCLLAACGSDDVDLGGMYQVDTAVESEPCGTDAPQAMPPAFLKFEKMEFFGEEYYSMEECTDAAGSDCSGGGLFGDSFYEPIVNGWRGVLTSSSSGGSSDPMCRLFFSESSALLMGTTLTVESTDYSEEVANTEALCSTDEAERRGDSMACTRHEQLDATKL